MTTFVGLVRLGRDCEVRYSPDGTPICSFSGAYNYGKKGNDGRRATQWMQLTLWGERGEKLSAYLLKGTLVEVVADDLHVETYERRDGGTGTTLKARVQQVEFAGQRDGREDDAQAAPAPTKPQGPPMPMRTNAAPPRPAAGAGLPFDDMDDDIPF
jgi:single-strand DNA-binding protein